MRNARINAAIIYNSLVSYLRLGNVGRGGDISTPGGGAAGSVSPAAFPLLAPDGTSAAPSYSFASTTGAGLYVGGVNFGAAGTADVFLVRDAANVLAQRNGVTAQTFRVYDTFTDLSNYERVALVFASGGYSLQTENAGTGSARPLYLGVSGVAKWQVSGTTGHLQALTDNTIDIGALGSNRPRNLYLSSSIKQVGGITTSGVVGAPAIVATGRATAQAAANASVSTFTVGAADASFDVSANVLVTTATTHNFTVTCSYTSEDNVARVLTLNFSNLAGAFSTAIINTGGAIPYEGVVQHIRCKAATTITIGSAAGGTYTAVVYNIEGIIKQTA